MVTDKSLSKSSPGNNNDDDSSFILEAGPVVIGKNPLLAVSMKQVGRFCLTNFLEF